MPVQTLPVGRLVYGHPSKKIQKTDTQRKPVMKDGQPVFVHQFGVAYPKNVFNEQIWPIMYHAAKAVFQGYEPPLPPTTAPGSPRRSSACARRPPRASAR